VFFVDLPLRPGGDLKVIWLAAFELNLSIKKAGEVKA
jgi:hypothetical protein